MNYYGEELQNKVIPIVGTNVVPRGAYYQTVSDNYGYLRFMTLLSNRPNTFASKTSFKYSNEFLPGISEVTFYPPYPVDGSIIMSREVQHEIVTSYNDVIVINPALTKKVSNQHWARLLAVPVPFKDAIAAHTFRLKEECEYRIYPHDFIILGNQQLEIKAVRYTEGDTGIELDTYTSIYSDDESQSCFLIASPAYESDKLRIENGIGPSIVEIPFACHLDLELKRYDTIRLHSAYQSKAFYEETLEDGKFFNLVERPIQAGGMLSWDIVSGIFDYDGTNLVINTGNEKVASIEFLCEPFIENRNVTQYFVEVSTNVPVTLYIDFLPNERQKFEVDSASFKTIRVNGPASFKHQIEKIIITVVSEHKNSRVTISDFTPDVVANYMSFTSLVVAKTSKTPLESYDVMMSLPQIKPQWQIVEELYLRSDIGAFNAGYLLGTAPDDSKMIQDFLESHYGK